MSLTLLDCERLHDRLQMLYVHLTGIFSHRYLDTLMITIIDV